ncbi:hypothetical protein SEA_SOOS_85 [Gordonia phage Soos]|nr:hypothetical protein SEA_SOOS_85 [Gordonia phage Soos]
MSWVNVAAITWQKGDAGPHRTLVNVEVEFGDFSPLEIRVRNGMVRVKVDGGMNILYVRASDVLLIEIPT